MKSSEGRLGRVFVIRLEDGDVLLAAANVLISVLACLVLTWLGMAAAKSLT